MIDEELQKRLIFEWLDALRSGTWAQAFYGLEDKNGNCCLGVFCRVAMGAGVPLIAVKNSDSETRDVGFRRGNDSPEYSTLPSWLAALVGLASEGGQYQSGSLMGDNDAGKTFSEIADIIEANAETLFTNGATVRGWLNERKANASCPTDLSGSSSADSSERSSSSSGSPSSSNGRSPA